MSLLIAYLADDRCTRIHINEYKKDEHRGRVVCGYGHPVIGKQGMKKAWHYSHVSAYDSDCVRVMGTWHRWWQDRVEKDFLEIIIERDGKKHIADMINGDDLVIEFQKSVIPQETIIEREEFYDNMIWVFYCGEHQATMKEQRGRYATLSIHRGSKFFLAARKRMFLDFDMRGVLEVIKVRGGKRPKLDVKIWTMREFDQEFMRGCLREDADTRIHRRPYSID